MLFRSLNALAAPDGPLTNPGARLVDSDITENTTWGKKGGPYLVNRTVTVTEGATLKILPGTSVTFKTGANLIDRKSVV